MFRAFSRQAERFRSPVVASDRALRLESHRLRGLPILPARRKNPTRCDPSGAVSLKDADRAGAEPNERWPFALTD